MSIVAHQYNILSEQLRRGIGGMNTAKKQASEQALKMEQLKYGIEKDKRVEARAGRADVRAEAAGVRAEEAGDRAQAQEDRTKELWEGQEFSRREKQAQSTEIFKRNQQMRDTELTPELIRKDIDPHGTMDDDAFLATYNKAVEESGAENIYQAVNSGIFKQHMFSMTDQKHRKATLVQLEGQLGQYEQAKAAGETEDGDETHAEEVRAGVKVLQDAIDNPLDAAEKKMSAMMNIHQKITDPAEISKSEFLINKHQKRIDSLVAGKTAKAKGTEHPMFRMNYETGQVEKEYTKATKLNEEDKAEGWSMKDPSSAKPFEIDPANKEYLRKETEKVLKTLTQTVTKAGLEDIDAMSVSPSKLTKMVDSPTLVAEILRLRSEADWMQKLAQLPSWVTDRWLRVKGKEMGFSRRQLLQMLMDENAVTEYPTKEEVL